MKKLAICIGNNDYQYIGALKYAVSDAEAMKEKLSMLDFEVQLYKNLDRDSMIDSIMSNIEKLGSYDAFLLFYSGHGFEVDGENLLMPTDINLNSRNEIIKVNSCALNTIFEKLCDFPNITKIIILDACRQVLGPRGNMFNGFAPVMAHKELL